MIFTFENSLGSIDMHGGGGKSFNIISADGLSFVEKRFSTVKYYGIGGQTTVNDSDMQRIITIGGDMLFDRVLAEKAVKILSRDTTLTIKNGEKRRSIECKTLSFELCEKIGKYRKFILQLECDKPYFTDEEARELPMFKRENMVTGEMTLPCVFTKRYEDSSLFNDGDERVYPIITISAYKTSGIEGEKYLKITNETTQKEIILNCDMAIGEIITIDLEKRKITSNTQGNLLNFLGDCYLSDFYLDAGMNKMLFENHTSSFGEAVISYKSRYRECVF